MDKNKEKTTSAIEATVDNLMVGRGAELLRLLPISFSIFSYPKLRFIDQNLWRNDKDPWEGPSSNRRNYLIQFGKNRDRAKSLLNGYNEATGTYLGRLASKYPDRVIRARKSNSRDWVIYAPHFTNDGMTPNSKKVKKKFRFK